jgi:hypothetical protein
MEFLHCAKISLKHGKHKFKVYICSLYLWNFFCSTIENLGKIIGSRGETAAASRAMPSNIETYRLRTTKLFDEWDNKLEFIHEFVKARNEGEFETMGLPLKIALAQFFYIKKKT